MSILQKVVIPLNIRPEILAPAGDRERLEALREEMARGLAQAYLEGMAGLGFGRAEAEARLKREGEE